MGASGYCYLCISSLQLKTAGCPWSRSYVLCLMCLPQHCNVCCWRRRGVHDVRPEHCNLDALPVRLDSTDLRAAAVGRRWRRRRRQQQQQQAHGGTTQVGLALPQLAQRHAPCHSYMYSIGQSSVQITATIAAWQCNIGARATRLRPQPPPAPPAPAQALPAARGCACAAPWLRAQTAAALPAQLG